MSKHDDTTEIVTTCGIKAIIDTIDSDLSALTWCAVSKGKPYLRREETIDRKTLYFRLHRVILERKIGRLLFPDEICDHINGDILDNRRSNLRIANKKQNSHNRKKAINNKSGFKGVRWQLGGWRADIGADGKIIYLGRFKTSEEAHEAYCEAAIKYHGEFARFK